MDLFLDSELYTHLALQARVDIIHNISTTFIEFIGSNVTTLIFKDTLI